MNFFQVHQVSGFFQKVTGVAQGGMQMVLCVLEWLVNLEIQVKKLNVY